MSKLPSTLVLAALVSGAAACSSSNPVIPVIPQDGGGTGDSGQVPGDGGTDGGTVPDNGAADGGNTSPDGGRTDGSAPTDAPAVDAGPPYDPCAAGAVIDLATAGMRTGATTRYAGSNTMVGGMSPLTAACTHSTGHEVALRYTPMTAGRLRVSTANMGTGAMFDTVVFAQDRCAAAGAMSLGCNDDGHDPTLTRASVFVSNPVAAGTAIYIVVAGYTPASSAMWSETGAFVLTVTELVQVAVGGACDTTGATNFCIAGSSCAGTGAAARCVADGAAGGACRTAAGMPACDTGLACNGTTCVMAVAVGGACTDTMPCVTTATCQGTGATARCVANGAAGGACRTAAGMPVCDMGLACNNGPMSSDPLCRTAVAANTACDPTGVMNACTAPSQCITTGTASVCTLPPYTETALATPTFIDACTGGTRVTLAASMSTNPRDDNHAAMGATIPFTFQFFGAAVTQAWADTNGFVSMGATAPTSDPTGGISSFPSMESGPLIAPFWQDLILPASPGSDLCVRTVGTAPSRQFVVEWLNATGYMHPMVNLTFETVLTETTNTVDMIYSHLDAPMADAMYATGAEATIGLQNTMGARYVSHAGTVTTTTGIRFAPR